ncbi:methyltransferase domain-containing protein [Nakamurella sp. YIM 132087]|uniref:Methyltransferase domain-containing protein n=1 Tax=Nakamurella alba TaxID=2665158 RepID=A0A7K1FKM2_9ACTN|nr:methyltransferase domain-containing protein [Nakamurella alba]MTD14610.1 methyltransferase domain-containing protein [Nakamurella alba]
MPMSSAEGKDWIKERVHGLAADGPVEVLDIGPGVGTYAKLLAGPQVSRLTGVEVWEPYIHTYRLHRYYDDIIVGDAREVDFPSADVVILGDVAEHMSEADALALWEKSVGAARRAVYLSIPIVHYPQGEIEGNHHEVHVVEDWSHDKVLASFPGIGDSWTGTEVGVYELRK